MTMGRERSLDEHSICIDATIWNRALRCRSIVRRNNGESESYEEFLTKFAKGSGIGICVDSCHQNRTIYHS
jgi:hypothetical protein